MNKLDSTAERNARVAARGEYMRWLAKRFGDIDLILTMQGEDRVSLRKVYVPLRLDTQDRDDEAMGDPDGVSKEQLPGRDALDLIAEQPFVAISGRPGSGKTTLVQAIVGELAGDGPSDFRKRLVGRRGMIPVPLILRDYQDELADVQTLDGLLDLWWAKAEREARDKGQTLDIARLRRSYAQDGDGIPLLLVFDGIDEVGGPEPRDRVLGFAVSAGPLGYRTVLTGRPVGFQGLDLGQTEFRDFHRQEAEQLGPGAVPGALVGAALDGGGLAALGALIGDVATKETRTTASSRTERTSPSLYHLQPLAWPQIGGFIDRFFRLRREWQVERERLTGEFDGALSDARRPHLLTLARRPILLTLMALVHATDRRMPHGRADLYRRIVDLYLVRQTQQRRLGHTTKGEPMPHWDEREVRRALGYLAWRSQHRGAQAQDAEERDRRQVIWSRAEIEHELRHLLDGENPALGHFADLVPDDAPRLLDYFLYPTGLLVDPAEGRYQFAHLSFQEYLCAEYIHGRAKSLGSRRFLDGIQDLLYRNLGLPGWDEVGLLLLCIHAAEGAQAEQTAHLELLAELGPADLPQARLLIDALTGRELDYPEGELARWLPVAAAAALVQPDAGLAERFRQVAVWTGPGLDLLRDLFRAEDPFGILLDRIDRAPPAGLGAEDWRGRAPSLTMRERWRSPVEDDGWEVAFGPDEARASALLRLANASGWVPAEPGNEDRVPLADPELESALADWLARWPADGEAGVLWRRVAEEGTEARLPVVTGAAGELDLLVPDRGEIWEALAARCPVDAWLLQGESAGDGFLNEGSQPSVLLGLYPGGPLLPRTRIGLGLYQVLVRSLSRSLPMPMPLSVSVSVSMLRSLTRSRSLLKALERAERGAEALDDAGQDRLLLALETFGYRSAALDWFDEQAEDPDLMRRRGLRPGQPLPPDLDLFDAQGRPRPRLQREALVRLRAWVEDDAAVLGWFFPEGLSAADDKDLRGQLDTLHHYQRPDGGRGQPWSPMAALDAALADWPQDQPTRDLTLAAAEADLLAVLKDLFPPDDPGHEAPAS